LIFTDNKTITNFEKQISFLIPIFDRKGAGGTPPRPVGSRALDPIGRGEPPGPQPPNEDFYYSILPNFRYSIFSISNKRSLKKY
jgi:hypothetical protein